MTAPVSGDDYYGTGTRTGFAIARTMAEECKTLKELIDKLTERINK